jgi:hypothetical protein
MDGKTPIRAGGAFTAPRNPTDAIDEILQSAGSGFRPDASRHL